MSLRRNNPNCPPLPADLVHLLPPALSPLGGLGGGDPFVRRALAQLVAGIDILVATDSVARGFAAEQFTVGTTPVQIIDGREDRGYIITNPSPSVGLTASENLLTSAQQAASGNTQATPVGVAAYRTARLFLDVTVNAAARSVLVNPQSRDPQSLSWATVQNDIFGAPTTTGTFYASIGEIGVDQTFAIAWTIGGAGALPTWSLTLVLKDGLPGGQSGLGSTVFLGGTAAVTTTSGYALPEGKELRHFLRVNTQIWAVSAVSAGVTIGVFRLQ